MQNFQLLFLFSVLLSTVYFTRRIFLGFLFAGLLGCLITAEGNFISALALFFQSYVNTVQLKGFTSLHLFFTNRRLVLLSFLLLLGIFIKLLKYSGVSFVFAHRVRRMAKNNWQAQVYGMMLPFFMFVDGDVNVITSSYLLPALTDYFYISRLKVGYLVSNVALAVSCLMPISSWAAFISLSLEKGCNLGLMPGMSNGYWLYLQAWPFMLYPILLLFSVAFNLCFKTRYGKIGESEVEALRTKDVFAGDRFCLTKKFFSHNELATQDDYQFFDFLFPMCSLPLSVLSFVVIQKIFGNWAPPEAFVETSLFCGVIGSIIISVLYFFVRGYLNFSKFLRASYKGFKMMRWHLLTLSLIWTYMTILEEQFNFSSILGNFINSLCYAPYLPLVLVLFSSVLSFLLGSFWAGFTVTLLTALRLCGTLPVHFQQHSLLSFALIGAVVSGVFFGVSLSPISNLYFLKTKNLQVSHLRFIRANVAYTFPVYLTTVLLFLIGGLLEWKVNIWQWFAIVAAGCAFLSLVFVVCTKLFAVSEQDEVVIANTLEKNDI